MSKWKDEETETSLVVPEDRVKVTVSFIVKADSIDDAQAEVKDIIEGGILYLIDEEDREPIEAWDVEDAEPAEL
jgi:hypothetical protein